MTDMHPAARELMDALIARDDARARSLQRGPGFSDLMGCARKMYHRVQGDAPCNADRKRLPSILGTIVHESIADLELPGLAETALLLEEADLPGTADRIHDGILTDWKTTKLKSLDYLREHGPSRQYRAQVHTYAYAANQTGHHVRTVRLVFIPKDGTEDDITVWEEPYDEAVALEAIAWYRDIAVEAAAGQRPRPEKDPEFCRSWCPFYGDLCPGRSPEEAKADEEVSTDPWLADAAAQYARGAEMEKEGKALKNAARDELGGFAGRVGEYRVSWTHRRGAQSPDAQALTEHWRATRDDEVPMKIGKGSVFPTAKRVKE